MGELTGLLLKALDQLLVLLESVEEKRWHNYFARAKDKITASDFDGVTMVIHAFGGMGSFSDLVIHRLNNHKVQDEQISEINKKLTSLGAAVYEAAQKVNRNYNS